MSSLPAIELDFDPETDLLNRREAAALLSRLLHSPVAVRTLSAWPLPFIRVGHLTLYTRAEVEAFARARLANAPRSIGRISRP